MKEDRKGTRKGFKSLYNMALMEGWDLKNTGYLYEDNLIEKNFSRQLLKSPIVNEFLNSYIKQIILKSIDSVKFLRIYKNYASNKETKHIN